MFIYGGMSLFYGVIFDVIGCKLVIIVGMLVYVLVFVGVVMLILFVMLLGCCVL